MIEVTDDQLQECSTWNIITAGPDCSTWNIFSAWIQLRRTPGSPNDSFPDDLRWCAFGRFVVTGFQLSMPVQTTPKNLRNRTETMAPAIH
jgi:hypothetical protein